MNKKLIFLHSLIISLMLPVFILAFSPGSVPNAVPAITINDVIDIIFSIIWPISVAFIIIIFVIIGFLFSNAQGDPTKVSQARLALIGGVIITIIVLLAFSIPFIIRNLLPGV